jgi:hypothetical protein
MGPHQKIQTKLMSTKHPACGWQANSKEGNLVFGIFKLEFTPRFSSSAAASS